MQAVLRDLISRGDAAVPCLAMLDVLPQLVGSSGLAGLKRAIADPERYAIEPKVDGVRGLLAFLPDGTIESPTPRSAVADLVGWDGA